MDSTTRNVAVVLFDGFEVLDVFGPVELFSRLPDSFALTYVAAEAGRVRSAQDIEVIASDSFATAPTPDIVMVPGGMGTRKLVDDRDFLDSLATCSAGAELDHLLLVGGCGVIGRIGAGGTGRHAMGAGCIDAVGGSRCGGVAIRLAGPGFAHGELTGFPRSAQDF